MKEKESALLGKQILHEEDFVFDLDDISAISAVEDQPELSVIFINGQDLYIKYPYTELIYQYEKIKHK